MSGYDNRYATGLINQAENTVFYWGAAIGSLVMVLAVIWLMFAMAIQWFTIMIPGTLDVLDATPLGKIFINEQLRKAIADEDSNPFMLIGKYVVTKGLILILIIVLYRIFVWDTIFGV